MIRGYAPKIENGTEIEIIETNPFNSRKPVNIYKVKISNGEFRKQIKTGKGHSFFIKVKEEMKEICLEPGDVKIDFPSIKVTDLIVGENKSALEYDEFLKEWKNQLIYAQTLDIQNKWLENGNTVAKAKYDSAKVIYDQERVSFILNKLKEKPASFINSLLLSNIMGSIPEKQITTLYEGLNKEARTNKNGRYIKYNIDSLFIDGTAPDFVQSDTVGTPLKLKDFRGKYVLLDFWASWCIPCRAENPNLILANEKFRHRNFVILSVSLDSKRNLWIDAIKKDKLVWPQISDLNGWNNWISKKYGVKAVPNNFLIGPDGKILARNLRGKKLFEKLDELLK